MRCLCALALLVLPALIQADGRGDPTKGPTRDRLALIVQSKVEANGITQTHRFLIRAQQQHRIRFGIGKAGIITSNKPPTPQKPNEWQILFILSFTQQPSNIPAQTKVLRTLTVGESGASIKTGYTVPVPKKPTDLIHIKANSGLYPLREPITIGNFQDKRIVIEVTK